MTGQTPGSIPKENLPATCAAADSRPKISIENDNLNGNYKKLAMTVKLKIEGNNR